MNLSLSPSLDGVGLKSEVQGLCGFCVKGAMTSMAPIRIADLECDAALPRLLGRGSQLPGRGKILITLLALLLKQC
jgi:hypothetical protein